MPSGRRGSKLMAKARKPLRGTVRTEPGRRAPMPARTVQQTSRKAHDHDDDGEAVQDGAVEVGRGVLHQLSARVGEQRRPGAGLDPRGVQEDRRQVRLPPLGAREQLVPALRPQPRQPVPFRRAVPAGARPRRPPPHRAPRRDPRSPRGRLPAGSRTGRHLHDEGAEGEEGRSHQEPEHDQERLVAHPGAPGHRADAQGQRDDDGRRRDRRVPLRRRLVRQPGDARPDGEPIGAVAEA